jgi:hypothetical protein
MKSVRSMAEAVADRKRDVQRWQADLAAAERAGHTERARWIVGRIDRARKMIEDFERGAEPDGSPLAG